MSVITNGSPKNPQKIKIDEFILDEPKAQEIACLAVNIYYESRSESVLGQVAVAAVTMNRLETGKWGDSVCDVVWAYKQFSWTIDKNIKKVPKEQEAWEFAQKVAYDVWHGYRKEIEDPTFGATHFHANYVKPKWSKRAWNKNKIGRHIFMNTAF
jgi:N-acetylmuramoyl-L-alanine amidase